MLAAHAAPRRARAENVVTAPAPSIKSASLVAVHCKVPNFSYQSRGPDASTDAPLREFFPIEYTFLESALLVGERHSRAAEFVGQAH